MMFLESIKFKNFRNYSKEELFLGKKLNIIIGENGQGKTNILEGIYFLSTGKSHRTNSEIYLIKDEMKHMEISGKLNTNFLNSDLKVLIQSNKKILYHDGVKINLLKDYVALLKVILFTPDDLEIIKGAPILRRNLMDTEITQISKFYFKLLSDFKKIKKIRNSYLKSLKQKENKDYNYLSILDEKFSDLSSEIMIYRLQFISNINKYIGDIYLDLIGIKDLKVEYKSTVSADKISKSFIKNETNKKLFKTRETSIMLGSTLVGIHKDDLLFKIKDKELKNFGSQAQIRLAVIAFKLAELEVFKSNNIDKPVLLLDDVFSELDEVKKNNLIKYINKDYQTIITTTDINNIDEDLIKKSNIYNVNAGKVNINKEVQNGKSSK